jgi:hypothetical protein
MILKYETQEALIEGLLENPSQQHFSVIKDYKSFADWNAIPLRHLTVLLGANSAGKSTVIQALDHFCDLMSSNIPTNKLSQSSTVARSNSGDSPCVAYSAPFFVPARDEKVDDFVRHYSFNFSGIVSQEKNKLFQRLREDRDFLERLRKLRWTCFLYEVTEDLELEIFLGNISALYYRTTSASVEIKISEKIIRLLLGEKSSLEGSLIGGETLFEFEVDDTRFDTRYTLSYSQTVFGSKKSWSTFAAIDETPIREPENQTIWEDERRDLYILVGYLTSIQFGNLFNRQTRFGHKPVRSITDKWFLVGREWDPELVKDYGDEFNEYVAPSIDLLAGSVAQGNNKKIDRINHWLTNPGYLDTPYKLRIDIRSIVENGKEIQYLAKVQLTDKKGRNLSFREVGSGYEQVLPVLASLATELEENFSQPELHLHPKMHSRLADCFIDQVNMDLRLESQQPTYRAPLRIIETHSEHVILRFLKRIRMSYLDPLNHTSFTLKPNFISIIYFSSDGESTKANLMELTESGEFIDKWPEGFFDERLEDLF